MVTNPANQPIAPASGQIQQVALGAVSPVTVEKFVKMIDIIRQNYVTNVDDESLFANAMAGTLAALDPYSEYLDANAFENLRLFTEGDIGSIGVSVSFHADVDSWVFDDVLPNSPAAKAGIQRGNYLHQINDNKLDNTRTSQDVDQLLTGIAGTTARLLVSDKGRRKHLVVVQRTLLQQQAMSTNIINGVAVVHIPVFQNNTQQQFLMALTKLNQPFSVLVLDLRNNPGGVLSAANDIASLFMNDKVVVQIKNRQGIQEVMRTHGKAQFTYLPLVVLQNRYSASAAEVLASALQNNQRAKVYGETSYGKGSIQSIVPINDSEAVKLTVAHYYSSKGEKIDGVGVKPDVALTGAETSWQDQVLADLQTTKRSNQFLLKPTPTPQSF
ncbi:S41 family peptidase [Moraxella osloensis]|nr:S41 family peptidase [Moraxella osloensis]